jgi:hypothetical protein
MFEVRLFACGPGILGVHMEISDEFHPIPPFEKKLNKRGN